MEKVKVSKEVAQALDLALSTRNKEKLLNEHFNKAQWNFVDYLTLNELTNWEMAQILIKGYEVEETVEEILLKEYIDCKERAEKAENNSYLEGYWHGYRDSICDVIEIQGEKIKGIND